jgi:hypothetical protein
LIRRASAEKVHRAKTRSCSAIPTNHHPISKKKNPALSHGALLLTALGFQRLAVSDVKLKIVSNLRLKIQKATAPR